MLDRNRLGGFSRILLVVVAFASFLSITGCAVQLAPPYDKTIVDGLTTANEQTLTLFASLSGGVPANSYGTREATYNALIGKFDALRVQAEARPQPRPLLYKVLGIGPDVNSALADAFKTAPSIPVLKTLVATMTRMRDSDKAGRLTPGIIAGFKTSYETSIDQALTYEKALER